MGGFNNICVPGMIPLVCRYQESHFRMLNDIFHLLSHCTSNGCNMGMGALPDMYVQLPEGCRPEGRGHTYQEKPECHHVTANM